MGTHPLTLQWIGWDRPGQVRVVEQGGALWVSGDQRNRHGDFLHIEGRVAEVRDREFVLEGKVVTRVSHIAQGRVCNRSGRLTFRRSRARQYWRMRQMANPCDRATDYVDVFTERSGAEPEMGSAGR